MIAPLDDHATTVEIAGRRYPICRLVCPNADDQDDTDEQRTLGGHSSRSDDIFIPAESGVLVYLDVQPDTGRIDACLHARICELSPRTFVDSSIWLPIDLRVTPGCVRPGWERHSHCEEWWLAEYIDRVAALPYEEPPGPACLLVPWGSYPPPRP